ncbi:MAG: MFS transporter [Lentisphaeria bacterium]|nr:MFS transporter [Lentisphaeria bacterium]
MKRLSLRLGVLDCAVMCCFLVYSASAVLLAISFVEMAKPEELNFSMTGGGAIHAIRIMTVFFVLFGSGFAAARFGKCLSIGVSAALLVAGLLLAGSARSYGMLVPAVGIIGLGQGCIEGLLNPVIQDLHPEDSGRYLNFHNAFWSIGVVGTMVLGGELLSWGVPWRALFCCTGIFAAVPAWLFLRHRRRLPLQRRVPARRTFFEMRRAFRIPRFWMFFLMMILAGAAEAAFTYWSASYLQTGFGSTARFAGFGAAVFSCGMIATRVVIGASSIRQEGLKRLLTGSAWAGLIVTLIFPLAASRSFVVFMLFMAGVTTSCFWPTLQSYAADVLRADSTMIFILLSCAGIPGAGLMVFAMGALGDLAGLKVSYFAVPPAFAGLIAMLRKDGSIRWRRCRELPVSGRGK